jgi:hypothetical protein
MIKDADFYRAWAERMYRAVDSDCDNIILETHLRKVCVEGTAVRQKYGVSLCRSLANIKTPNRYLRYFLLRAKDKKGVGGEVFSELVAKGGYQYTNEYQFLAYIPHLVTEEVKQRCVDAFVAAGIPLDISEGEFIRLMPVSPFR